MTTAIDFHTGQHVLTIYQGAGTVIAIDGDQITIQLSKGDALYDGDGSIVTKNADLIDSFDGFAHFIEPDGVAVCNP